MYSEADQRLIEEQELVLEQLDHAFYRQAAKQGMTTSEAYHALMGDPTRKSLLDGFIKSRAVMVPAYYIEVED